MRKCVSAHTIQSATESEPIIMRYIEAFHRRLCGILGKTSKLIRENRFRLRLARVAIRNGRGAGLPQPYYN